MGRRAVVGSILDKVAVPLGRQIKLEVKLEDGTIFRHPKKEGSNSTDKVGSMRMKCVSVRKAGRCLDIGN